MANFSSPNPRLMAPLPRRDILAICAYLNRNFARAAAAGAKIGAEIELDRVAAAARMQ